MVNAIGMCMFARKIYDHPTIIEAMNSIGWHLTDEDLDQIGKRILRTKLRIKAKYGFSQKAVRLPKRFFETPTMHGVLQEDIVNKMMKLYIAKTNDLMSTPDPLLDTPAGEQAPDAKPAAGKPAAKVAGEKAAPLKTSPEQTAKS